MLLWGAVVQATPVGSIFSGPTSADGAVVYWNPAAMTRTKGTDALLFGGATFIQLNYQRATPSAFNNRIYPEAKIALFKPNLAMGIVTDLGLGDRPSSDPLRNLRLGIGFAIPVLEGASWKDSYQGQPASTRYYGTYAHQALIYTEVALAYRINRYVSVGAGVDIITAWVTSNMSIDFGGKINQLVCTLAGSTTCPLNSPLKREDPSLEGLVEVDGSGVGAGGVVGVMFSFPPWLRAGISFHSGAISIDVPITINVDLPPEVVVLMKKHAPSFEVPPLRAEAEAEVSSPMTITAGVSGKPLPELELSLDLHWIDSSSSTEMLVHVSNTNSELIGDQVLVKTKKDSFQVGLRGVLDLLPGLKLALRFEYSSNTRPEAFVTPLSMDFHIFNLYVGAGWRLLPWLGLTLEYGHSFLVSRTIRVSNFSPRAFPKTPVEEGFDNTSPTGEYSGMADSLSLGIMLDF